MKHRSKNTSCYSRNLIICIIIHVLVLISLVILWRSCRKTVESDEFFEKKPAVVAYWENLTFPTEATNILQGIDSGEFQPTASGRPESALYGSVRTGSSGHATFHAGIDIRALRRDRRGIPLDPVYAVNDGKVAYINRIAGNSNYGIYIVLIHHDAVGEVYTLYSHLASASSDLKPGMPVRAGQQIGVIGNTPARIIPMNRAHLHFEVGLVINARFPEWFHQRHASPNHGVFHGWNLLALDPLEFLREGFKPGFTFLEFIQQTPVAIELVLDAGPQEVDYFLRYPALWQSNSPAAGPMVLQFCQNGLALSGRAASTEERAQVGGNGHAILRVDEDVLGRNGRRLIINRNGNWQLTDRGRDWLGILLFPHSI